MPKEGESSTSAKVPLKRGDACLYCRKRRIRCSAEKPTCQHCKGKRECVYDNGKPVSRVRQLEDKVAQLEGLLRGDAGASSSRRPSEEEGGAGVPQPPLKHHSSDNSTSAQSVSATQDSGMDAGEIDFDMLPQGFGDITGSNGLSNDFFTFGGSMMGANEPSRIPDVVAQSLPADPASMFDFSTLDPNFMSLVNSFNNTLQGYPNQQPFQPGSQAPPASSFRSSFPSAQQPSPAFSQQQASASSFGSSLPDSRPQTGTAFTSQPADQISMFSQPPWQQQASWPTQPAPPAQPTTTSAESSTGLTPFLNNDFSSPSNPDPSPPATSGYASAADLAPTPGHHFEHLSKTVSYNVHGGALPTAAEANGTAALNPNVRSVASTYETSSGDDGVEELIAQALGSKTIDDSYPGIRTEGGGGGFSSSFTMPADSRGGKGVDLDQEGGFELVGGWFDANDLPRVARDHLLDLFFSGMRMFSAIFHIPRFFASLTLPVAKRPHPCLLHSMYLLASRISSSPSIRALEKLFYSIASRQLEESIARADRLFDATRAATILATYKYSNARYHEGWMMIGLAARLGVSCGLHQIPSSVFKPSPLPRDRSSDLVSLLRQRTFCIPPPVDAIELGERINAFWSIYMTERCGTISAQWPPSITDDVVTTPYPKPLHEYELGLVSEADDQSVSTLYDPSPPKQTLPHYATSTEPILRARGLAILERASKLMYLRPEPEFEQAQRAQSQSVSPAAPIDEYLFYQNVNMTHGPDFLAARAETMGQTPPNSNSTGTQGKAWMRCAKIRTPKAFEEVKLALLKVEADLPPERKTDWSMWDGRVQDWHYTASRMDNYSLHFILGCAWMFLFDVFAYNAENTDAVNVARRLTQTVRCMRVNVAGLGGDFDVFIAMTWSFISKILIREVKRLQALGDTTSAALIEGDVEVIISALKSFGQRYNIAGMQAMRAERYRKSTLDEMKVLERNEVDAEA